MRCRVKTKEELIEEWGDDWKLRVPSNFVRFEDEILGKELLHPFLYNTSGMLNNRYTVHVKCVVPLICEENKAILDEMAVLKEVKKNLTIHTESDIVVYASYKGYSTFRIFKEPTANCQVASIFMFQTLLDNLGSEEIVNVLNVSPRAGKRLLLFDIKNSERYHLKLKAMPVTNLHPYNSSNGSQMMTGFLNLPQPYHALI